MAAAPIGAPGWPDFACCTASAESIRIVLMLSCSSSDPWAVEVAIIGRLPEEEIPLALNQHAGSASIDLPPNRADSAGDWIGGTSEGIRATATASYLHRLRVRSAARRSRNDVEGVGASRHVVRIPVKVEAAVCPFRMASGRSHIRASDSETGRAERTVGTGAIQIHLDRRKPSTGHASPAAH